MTSKVNVLVFFATSCILFSEISFMACQNGSEGETTSKLPQDTSTPVGENSTDVGNFPDFITNIKELLSGLAFFINVLTYSIVDFISRPQQEIIGFIDNVINGITNFLFSIVNFVAGDEHNTITVTGRAIVHCLEVSSSNVLETIEINVVNCTLSKVENILNAAQNVLTAVGDFIELVGDVYQQITANNILPNVIQDFENGVSLILNGFSSILNLIGRFIAIPVDVLGCFTGQIASTLGTEIIQVFEEVNLCVKYTIPFYQNGN